MSGSRNRSARQLATDVVRTLHARGHTAYFAVGACATSCSASSRRTTTSATDATPDGVSSAIQENSEVGAHFGVVLVRDRPHTIEVADVPRRRPVLGPPPTRRGDVQRRRARRAAPRLYDQRAVPRPRSARTRPASAGARRTGTVIDYVGGLEDLERGVVRAVGNADERLAEDHLRALRAVRFAARFGFHIEDATQEAIAEHARELGGVSRERVGDELRRMMGTASRGRSRRGSSSTSGSTTRSSA